MINIDIGDGGHPVFVQQGHRRTGTAGGSTLRSHVRPTSQDSADALLGRRGSYTTTSPHHRTRGTTTMSTSTAEGTTTVQVETTAADGSPVVIEGEIVGPAGEENSSPGTVAVPESAAVETSDLTKAEARKLADRIKRNLGNSVDQAEKMNKSVEDAATLMIEAYSKRIWLALDEESWEDFVSQELGEVRFRLDRAVRQSLVYRMREEAHMSQRAIAPVFGIDQKTVSNDVRQIKRERGIDAVPAKSVGKDGKTYEGGDKPAKVKPIEQRFTLAVTKAETAVNALFDLSTEDGFTEAAGAIAKANRADLAKLMDSLKAVQQRLQDDIPEG